MLNARYSGTQKRYDKALVAARTSALYAKNLYAFVETMIDKKEKKLSPDWEDELVKATLLTRDGAVVHPNFQPKS